MAKRHVSKAAINRAVRSVVKERAERAKHPEWMDNADAMLKCMALVEGAKAFLRIGLLEIEADAKDGLVKLGYAWMNKDELLEIRDLLNYMFPKEK